MLEVGGLRVRDGVPGGIVGMGGLSGLDVMG